MPGSYPPSLAKRISLPIETDIPCRKCRYNLRGLLSDAMCPECGSPVSLSMRGDLIRYSDPLWIDRLARGILLIFVAMLLLVSSGIFHVWNSASRASDPLWPQIVLLGETLVSAAGYWLLTTPDPCGLGESNYGTSRKLVRITLCIGLYAGLWRLATRMTHVPPAVFLPFELSAIVAQFIGCVEVIAALNYLSKLAMRIPDAPLERSAGLLRYSFGVPVGLIQATICISQTLFVTGTSHGRVPLVNGIAGSAALAALATGIMYLIMLERFRKRLKEQFALSCKTWPELLNASALP